MILEEQQLQWQLVDGGVSAHHPDARAGLKEKLHHAPFFFFSRSLFPRARMAATSAKITPEALQEMLQHYNLSRQEFINMYNIQPLVYITELPYSAKTTFVIMYMLIFVLALAGNSLVIYIVLKKRTIQTPIDIFICSLAVSDLLITFFCIPFTLLQNISSEWIGGEFLNPW